MLIQHMIYCCSCRMMAILEHYSMAGDPHFLQLLQRPVSSSHLWNISFESSLTKLFLLGLFLQMMQHILIVIIIFHIALIIVMGSASCMIFVISDTKLSRIIFGCMSKKVPNVNDLAYTILCNLVSSITLFY
jgi:hypothetical protein